MHSIPAERRKSGFTLIELLVVIAIIAILAAILFPVFARARENARRASCQSNEKNIALGFKQYIQDNNEVYPAAAPSGPDTKALGSNALGEYIKSDAIFFCPSDSVKTGSYGYDPPGLGDVAGKNESAVDNEAGGSSAVVLLTETGNRHFGGLNYAYVDGHVKWTKNGVAADATTTAPPPTVPDLPANLKPYFAAMVDAEFYDPSCSSVSGPKCVLQAGTTNIQPKVDTGTNGVTYSFTTSLNGGAGSACGDVGSRYRNCTPYLAPVGDFTITFNTTNDPSESRTYYFNRPS